MKSANVKISNKKYVTIKIIFIVTALLLTLLNVFILIAEILLAKSLINKFFISILIITILLLIFLIKDTRNFEYSKSSDIMKFKQYSVWEIGFKSKSLKIPTNTKYRFAIEKILNRQFLEIEIPSNNHIDLSSKIYYDLQGVSKKDLFILEKSLKENMLIDN